MTNRRRNLAVVHAFGSVHDWVSTMPQHCGVVDREAEIARLDADPLTIRVSEHSWLQFPDRECLEAQRHPSEIQLLPLADCERCASEAY